jgi:PadR family transcriptional regulator PadR
MGRRRSHQTKLVFQAFLDALSDETYGYELSKATGLASGVVYPILRRLEDEGLIESRWEEIAGADSNSRRRRFYKLTGQGRRVARTETAEETAALRLLSPGWSV